MSRGKRVLEAEVWVPVYGWQPGDKQRVKMVVNADGQASKVIEESVRHWVKFTATQEVTQLPKTKTGS